MKRVVDLKKRLSRASKDRRPIGLSHEEYHLISLAFSALYTLGNLEEALYYAKGRRPELWKLIETVRIHRLLMQTATIKRKASYHERRQRSRAKDRAVAADSGLSGVPSLESGARDVVPARGLDVVENLEAEPRQQAEASFGHDVPGR